MISKIKYKIIFSFHIFFAIAIFLSNTSNAYAKIDSEIWERLDLKTKKTCLSVKSVKMLEKDIPSENELLGFKNCDANKYYYGFEGAVPDYKKARMCALKLKDNHILAMLFANGYGVSKNLNLALHFVCLIDGSPAEITERVDVLKKMQKNENLNKKFELCDYVTSHDEAVRCSNLEYQSALDEENLFINKITQNFSKNEMVLLDKVRANNKFFAISRALNELDRMGRDASIYQTKEIINLIVKNTGLIYVLSSCKVNSYTEEEYLLADKILNRIYKKIINGPEGVQSYTIEGIKKTEQLWVSYKLSLEQLGLLRCPSINKFTWSTIATKRRLDQLKSIRLNQKLIMENPNLFINI